MAHWESHGLEEMADVIVAAVERQKRSPQWRKDGGQYVPGPLPWLRDESWEAPAAPQEPENAPPPRKPVTAEVIRMAQGLGPDDPIPGFGNLDQEAILS